MMWMRAQPPAGPRDELWFFLERLVHRKYYRTYARNAKAYYYLYNLLLFASVVSGLIATVVVALLKANQFLGVGQIFVAFASGLSVASIFTLNSLRLLDKFEAWESGRLEFDRIYAEGRRLFASAANDADYTRIHEDLIKQVIKADRLHTRKMRSTMGLNETARKNNQEGTDH